MAPAKLKPGNLKDPEVAELFSTKDPESRYEDLREIGHGAFGAVFYALDRETKEPVAIKKMNFSGKQSLDKWNDIIREVRFLRSIQHPQIVRFKACFLKEQTCWLVMEYCVGSAADILKVYKKPFLQVEIAAICQQTLQGIAYLHGIKRIHRDVKAGNILMTDCGQVKLADLGSASLTSPAQTFVGSPYWMAPEVILAQDSGIYDERADIWSFGITCIELAELKPPFLDMNAYSAMYHIAQNDPPFLQPIADPELSPWSEDFHSFVEQCLRKDPQQRLSTNACLAHPFITCEKPPNVIMNLINRIKNAVKEQDHSQYGRLRRLICMDANGHLNEENVEGIETQNEDISITSEDDINHQRQQQSNKLEEIKEENDEKQDNQHLQHQLSINNRTIISLNGTDSLPSSEPEHQQQQILTPSGILSLHSTNFDQQQVKDDINTLRRSKFSTLRTTKIIARELQEYQADNLYEQMCGYKRLRQQHHKELKQLEERCSNDADNQRLKLDREREQLEGNCQRETEKVRTQIQLELERRRRENEEESRKTNKTREATLKHDLKSYVAAQKKEYKFNKERCKMELKSQGLPKNAYEVALKAAKVRLNEIKQHVERKFADEQSFILQRELKELNKQQLLRFHNLETQLTNNELNIRARQLDTLHALLNKHHEIIKSLEFSHFNLIEQMKRRHLEAQHEAELSSQRDYNKRALEEKAKEHAMQSKQQPRELKAKEAIIRKQFRLAVKIQSRQFKAYQAHMLQLVPKEEHKELHIRLKEEQNRKIAALADQYELTIEKMVTEQTVKLDSQQEEDLRLLTEKLNKELSLLTDYQERQKASLYTQIERERVQLQDRLNLRLAVVQQKINDDKSFFDRTCEKRLSQLQKKQIAELELFSAANNTEGENASPTTARLSIERSMSSNINKENSSSSCNTSQPGTPKKSPSNEEKNNHFVGSSNVVVNLNGANGNIIINKEVLCSTSSNNKNASIPTEDNLNVELRRCTFTNL
uniref:non-specific serine/threonine protein kinase n=1 Tax=Meloidogyne enterolobii TaxID=390850 RepID=A0A6V7U8X4_MELEN|nr:unnamed protein product [Meloidogyne enterolobii]